MDFIAKILVERFSGLRIQGIEVLGEVEVADNFLKKYVLEIDARKTILERISAFQEKLRASGTDVSDVDENPTIRLAKASLRRNNLEILKEALELLAEAMEGKRYPDPIDALDVEGAGVGHL